MMKAKKGNFHKDLVEISEFAKTLSHPARLYILKILSEQNECICGEIVKITPLSQATVSQHLKELKKIGVIVGRIQGVKSCYCINRNRLKYLSNKMNTFFKNI